MINRSEKLKPSWTDIAAFGLLLFFALVMAKGWPSLKWDAISAVGTWVTGIAALWIANSQYRSVLKTEDYATRLLLRKVKEMSTRIYSLALEWVNAVENYSVDAQHDFSRSPEQIRVHYAEKMGCFMSGFLDIQRSIFERNDLSKLPELTYRNLIKLSDHIDKIYEELKPVRLSAHMGHSIKIDRLKLLIDRLDRIIDTVGKIKALDADQDIDFQSKIVSALNALDNLQDFECEP
ncbi:MAG TPA: hypothetical protein DD803_16610 [Alcaligenes faecalis]|nr:hypothetical protein [Alcaligenes faecalis]HBQ91060.1 hypothetical protein [Alcaligenes faecalis]